MAFGEILTEIFGGAFMEWLKDKLPMWVVDILLWVIILGIIGAVVYFSLG